MRTSRHGARNSQAVAQSRPNTRRSCRAVRSLRLAWPRTAPVAWMAIESRSVRLTLPWIGPFVQPCGNAEQTHEDHDDHDDRRQEPPPHALQQRAVEDDPVN